MARWLRSTPALASASMTSDVAPTRVSSVRIEHSQEPFASCSRISQSRAFSMARWIFSGETGAGSAARPCSAVGQSTATSRSRTNASLHRPEIRARKSKSNPFVKA